MKKTLSILLSLAMLLLTACGGSGNHNNGGNSTEPSGDTTPGVETPAVIDSVYEDITGIPGETVLATVDGNEIPAALYFYWTISNAQNLTYQLQTYAMYYGMYTEAFREDGTIDWSYELTPGMSLAQYLEQQTQSAASYYATVENMAGESGVTLTDEERAEMAAEAAEIAEQYRERLVEKDPSAADLSADEIMEKYLKTIGIDAALQNRLGAIGFLYEHLKGLVTTPGSALYLEDADCNQYGYYADHILISTIDNETRQPLSEEEVLEKTALARDILTRLEDSGNSVDLFNRLADEYSEDPGRQTNPTGYLFTPGTMVQEFESATEGLKYGEISGLVESDYGYHIILRKDIAEGLALYPDQKAMFVEEHLGTILNLRMNDSEIVFDEALTGFDYVKFYEDYTAMLKVLMPSAETATE